MKKTLQTFGILLLIILASTSCKKNRISNEYFTSNDWKLNKVVRFDDPGGQDDITYLYFDQDCRKENSNRFFSDNVYVYKDECSDIYYYDTLYWYYDNEEETKLHLYSNKDKEFPYFAFEILKANETELELKEIPIYDEGYYLVRYFTVK